MSIYNRIVVRSGSQAARTDGYNCKVIKGKLGSEPTMAGVAGTLVGDIKDISNSPAYSFLNELEKDGGFPKAVIAAYKTKYSRLHEYVLQGYEREKALLKKGRELKQELLGERISLEKHSIRKVEQSQVISNLEKEKEKASKELADCEELDSMLRYQMNELGRTETDLKKQLEQMRKANSDLVLPQINKVNDDIAAAKEEAVRQAVSFETEKKRKLDFVTRIEALRAEKDTLHEKKKQIQVQLSKLSGDPARIHKQAEVVLRASEKLEADGKQTGHKLAECDVELKRQMEKRKDATEIGRDLKKKIEQQRANIELREKDVATMRKNLDADISEEAMYRARRVELEMEMNNLKMDEKSETEQIGRMNTEYKHLKRKLKKEIEATAALKGTLPSLTMIDTDMRHTLASYDRENEQLKKSLEQLQTEVEIFVANYLKQEMVEKSKRDEMETLVEQRKSLEETLDKWRTEDQRMAKTINMLSAQREMKSKEASRASRREKETREELKVKELVILDLTKKCSETNNRLKEFSALYDVMKNERNNYVNLIQSSSQALAEMKEKIKILGNEVEILRGESAIKDRALATEQMEHQKSHYQRDALRMETNKCQEIYRKKQEQVEQQIVEIDKLNSIINAMEKEMLHLKRQYELAVEARNYTGIQLIDRNDELCILYEKANVQETTLKQGELGLRAREEDTRMMRLEIVELTRQIEVTRKSVPLLPELAEKILSYKAQLSSEMEVAEKLCAALETPQNLERWNELGGDDPDEAQLMAKVQVLEERLNDKKELLLEKELVHEEVTALSDKLKKQAAEGRTETLTLAKQVNEFQTRIKETTRKMMATVSELAMYQATAMKLQQEKHDREVEIEDASWRLEHGEPPTEGAEHEWFRMERDRLRRSEEKLLQKQGLADDGSLPLQITRTTAEPRPNAYIPNDLPLPRPYGAMAPFKPTVQGSIMRHFRKPAEKDIEI